MTVSLNKTATVSISIPARAGHGYETSGPVDRDKLLTVYRALRGHLDVDPDRRPFRYSVVVYEALIADGWDVDEARHYIRAARLACVGNLDPETGQPLQGLAALHPVRVRQARRLIREGLPWMMEDVDADEAVYNIVSLLAEAGYLR